MGGKRIACSESTQLQYLYSNEIEKMVEAQMYPNKHRRCRGTDCRSFHKPVIRQQAQDRSQGRGLLHYGYTSLPGS